MATNSGLDTDYEVLLPAYFALQLNTNPNIQDFTIESNVADLPNFNDLLVSIKLKNGDERTFAFELNKRFSLKEERARHHFIFFTNEKIEDLAEVASNHPCPGQDFFETSGTTSNIYHLEAHQNLSLYVKQKDPKSLAEAIVDFFKNAYHCDVAENYINFFRFWHVLTRADVTIHLIDLLLSPFVVVPNLQKLRYFKWNVLQEVGQHFDIIIDDTLDTVPPLEFTESEDDLLRIAKKNKIVSKSTKQLTAEEKNKTLCFFCHHHLILKLDADAKNFALIAMDLCQKINLELKLFLLTSLQLLEEIPPHIKAFYSLEDLFLLNEDSYEAVVTEIKIVLPGSGQISLEELMEDVEEVRRSITMKQLLQVSNFGAPKEVLPEPYITRTITKPTIDVEAINSLQDDIVLIDCNGFYTKIISSITRVFTNFVRVGEDNQALVILNEEETSQKQFYDFCQKNQNLNVHHLRAVNSDNFEWLSTSGNISQLKFYQLKKTYTKESKIGIRNCINIVCGGSGLGKTTLFKQLKNNYSPQFWTVLIDLKRYDSFLFEDYPAEEIINYLMELPEHTLQGKAKAIYLKTRKVCFFLDGFDELHESCFAKAVDFVKHLSSLHFHIWVSSRPHLSQYLENQFNCFSFHIEKLTAEEQKHYIRRSLQNTYTNEEIEDIVNRNCGSFGTPISLCMLTKILTQDYNTKLDLIQVYDWYFKAKYVDQTQYQHPCFFENDLKKRLQQYKIAALQVCIPNQFLEKLKLDCYNFLKKIANEGDPMGVVVAVNNGRAVFDHYGYAEYFSALWLAEHWSKLPRMQDFLFDEKHASLRLLFDIKLAEELPAHLSAIFGDTSKLIQHQEQIHLKDPAGRTPLHIACCYGQKSSILDLLLSSGCDPTVADQLFHWNSFSYADKTCNLLAINEMLKLAKPKLDDLHNYRDASTLLVCSAKFGFSNVLRWCKEINMKIAKNERLLHLSIKNGHYDVVKILLEEGANVKTTDDQGHTPVHCAISEGRFGIAELLIANGAPIDEDCLKTATMKKHLDIVALLIENDVDVNAKDQNGYSSLYWAVHEDCLDIAALLLNKGAIIDQSDNSGNTPVHWTCQKRDYRKLKFLLNFGANINLANKNGRTPLHLAVIKGCVDVVELLLHRGAAVNAIDKYYQRTPLHFAAHEGYLDVIKLLLDQGADINSTDIYKNLPMHLAVSQGHLQVMEMFLERGININARTVSGSTFLHISAERNSYDISKVLIDKGADVNAIDTFKGRCPLHLAIIEGNIEIVKLLLDKRADINATDNEQQSCLHLATRGQNFDIVKLLVERGIDVDKLRKPRAASQ